MKQAVDLLLLRSVTKSELKYGSLHFNLNRTSTPTYVRFLTSELEKFFKRLGNGLNSGFTDTWRTIL